MTVSVVRKPELDLIGLKASVGRHAIHSYPAMLHYKLTDHIIEEFGEGKKVLYDPFCGSGVALVEGLKKGMEVYGSDIHPIALLISEVRCSDLAVFNLDLILKKVRFAKPEVPEVKNIDYWFKPQAVEELGKIRSALKEFQEESFYKLLLVAFSQTVRSSSNNRKGEFKRYRMSEEELSAFNPQPIRIFAERLKAYLNLIVSEPIKNRNYNIFTHNILEKSSIGSIGKRVDLVITSPPYGDSRTTVAYEQFLSFSFEWLKGLNPYGDNYLGAPLGKSAAELESYPPIIDELYYLIAERDGKRAREIKRFYLDLTLACKNTVEMLGKDAKICFVVGNRKVSGITLPTSDVVVEIFESLGLKHVKTWVRMIHNKRMPASNSPTNRKGEKDNTMQKEHIVIMSL